MWSESILLHRRWGHDISSTHRVASLPRQLSGKDTERCKGVTITDQLAHALPAAAGGVNKLFTVSSIFPLAFLNKVGYIVLALRKSEC